MAFFELVNLSSGNRVGEYDTEDAALRDVRAVIERRGPAALAGIGLTYVADDGTGSIVAEGEELVRQARVPAGGLAG